MNNKAHILCFGVEIYYSNINHYKLIVFISLVNRYEQYIVGYITTKSSCMFLDSNKTSIKSYNEIQQFTFFPSFLHEI